MEKNFGFIQRFAFALIIIVLSYLVLTEAKQILYPIVLALLLAYLLFPAADFFEKKLKIPRVLSILLALLIGISILGGLANLFVLQIRVFVKDFPDLKNQAIANLQALQGFIDTKFHISAEEQEKWFQEQVANLFDRSNEILKSIFKSAGGTIEALLFIPIFSFFMLFYRERGRNFVLKLASTRDSKLTEDLLSQISKVTIKYIAGVLTVVIILSIFHSIALSIIGVKYAIPLAIMAATFSFIPYFGTLISGLLPLTFSLILSQSPYEPLFIIIYFVFITFIDHNILTPTITGGNVSLNPLATIIGLIVAADIWGIPGMIIIVPTLATIKIICDNIEGLEPYGYILGIEHHGMDLSKFLKFFRKKQKS
jgi:predicted PurR-regulated permease PerM